MARQSLDQLPAAQAELGKLLATFELNFRAARLGIFIAGLVFLIGPTFLIAGLSQPDGRGWQTPLFLITAGVLVMIVSGLLIRRLILGVAHYRVLVFADGLIEIQQNGFIRCLWSEVEKVLQEVSRVYGTNGEHLFRFFEVHMRDGTELHFREGIEQIEKLGQMIQDSTGRYLLPRTRQAIADGQIVDFGPISLRKEGLIRRLNFIPWENLDTPELCEGVIQFRQRFARETLCRVGCHEVPNLYVFLAIVSEMLAECRS